MSQRIKAVFQQGAFIPKQPYNLPEGSEVEIIVNDTYTIPPEVTDPEERKRILKEVVEDMRRNPFPENAPHFTRDEMHERR